MQLVLEEINLKSVDERNKVNDFLNRYNLSLEENIDYTIVGLLDGEMVATCSKSKNVFKCFAIDPKYRGEGITTQLLTNLQNKLFDEGVYHSFIFTMACNTAQFESIGYKKVYASDGVALLEKNTKGIDKTLDKLGEKYNINTSTEKATLVMNCNPFTKGHRYLIEQAAKSAEEVIVFIVEEDKSSFPFKDRFGLVKEGVRDLTNVKVVPGGEYIISMATFPSYFLKDKDSKLEIYTRLDAGIFGEYFCKKFNIKQRFVGTEPYCEVTNRYNSALKEKLSEYDVAVIEIERLKEDGSAISASKVREELRRDNMQVIKGLVPEVTWQYLNSQKAEKIIQKLKIKETRH